MKEVWLLCNRGNSISLLHKLPWLLRGCKGFFFTNLLISEKNANENGKKRQSSLQKIWCLKWPDEL